MKEKIYNHIHDLLPRLGFEVKSVSHLQDEDIHTDIFSIETDDPELLIGRNGDVLRAVNHIIHRMVEADKEISIGTDQSFFIDVDGYYQKNLQEIKTKARIVAERARSFKSDIALDPMSAYDRMVVHAYMKQYDDIETESFGYGKGRHVVIKYLHKSST